jgi:hypothetical protein
MYIHLVRVDKKGELSPLHLWVDAGKEKEFAEVEAIARRS